MTLTYVIDGTGWATATLVTPAGSVRMTASYLHDSLGDLARAVLALQDGETDRIVVFMDEPGEHQVRFHRAGDDVAIEVCWYDDWASWKLEPRHAPATILGATVPFAVLRKAVARALTDLHDTVGVEGYKEQWVEHDFPQAEYQRLIAS